MSTDISGWLAVGLSSLILLNFFALLISAYWKLGEVEQYFANSQLISDVRHTWKGGGPVAKFNRLAMIALAFTLTDMLHGKGLVDLREVGSVPAKLRLWIVIPTMSSCLVFVLAVVFYMVEKG
ncbi:hypothetical protein ABQX22_06425 [Xanthomonas sp. WHRI 1810A]|uniref:hypothetical protein n=1 Tax=Xanthomonas sp. WHRI 1810A TaxID=3161565 RepID=UPI0032E90DAC